MPSSRTATALTFIIVAVLAAVLPAAALQAGLLSQLCMGMAAIVVCVAAIVVMSRHKAGPAAFLLIAGPFQGILVANLGIVANFLTWLPVAVFLAGLPREARHHALLGTRVQRVTAMFVAALLLSLVLSFQHAFDISEVVSFGQKVTLFFLVAVFAAALSEPEPLERSMWVCVLATTIYYGLSIAEFYFGFAVYHQAGQWMDTGMRAALDQGIADVEMANNFRLRGWGDSMSINRFAYWGILPFCLAAGHLLTVRRKSSALLSLVCAVVLGFGIVASGSRSGILGLAASLSLIAVFVGRRYRSRLPAMMLVMVLLGSLFVALAPQEVLVGRLFNDAGSTGGRLAAWAFGLDLFLRSPLVGIGSGGFANAFDRSELYLLYPSAGDAHSAYLELLVERGFIAAVLFVGLIAVVVRRLAQDSATLGVRLHLWSQVCLAGLAGMLVANLFNTYQYERVMWIAIAMAAAMENVRSARLEAQPVPEAQPGISASQVVSIPSTSR